MTELDIDFKELSNLDPETLTIAHDHFFGELYRYVLYRVGDPMVAEDITSESFVRLVEALDQKRGPKTSLRGWLFGTASNLVADHFRKYYKDQTVDLSEDLEANQVDLQQQTEHKEDLEAVIAASRSLTTEQQHVLALRFGSELSVSETARVMSKQPNAIKALQFRALSSLRKNLHEEVS